MRNLLWQQRRFRLGVPLIPGPVHSHNLQVLFDDVIVLEPLQRLLWNHWVTWLPEPLEESVRQSFAVSHCHERAAHTIPKNLSRTSWTISGDDRQVHCEGFDQ